MSDRFLSEGDEERLRTILETSDSEIDRKRAEILLGFEEGLSMRTVAERVDAPVQRVLYWRREYLKRGLSLFDE